MSEAASGGRPPLDEDTRPGPPIAGRPLLWAALGFAVIVAALLGDLIVGEDLLMPSHPQGDGTRYFLFMRLFGYSQMQAGNLALWNPHTFSGTPFVGVFQSAIFYPPNLHYLVLDVRTAIGVELSLGLFLMAMFSFAWMRGHGMRPLAAFLGASLVILGATVSLRVLAGQLSVLGTFVWWPLLLLAIDRVAVRASLGWSLAGIMALSMMILAGHPPTVLQAGVATVLYCLPLLWASKARLLAVLRLTPLVLVPFLLTAVQLATGLHTASEGLRSAGMSFDFAVSHSFPPEQLLTLLVPEAFGNADEFNRTYFGRVFFWDATIYVGVVGFLLALQGALRGRGRQRIHYIWLFAAFSLMAMGGYTPIYRILYDFVPGFAYVRAPSKLLFYAAFFASALAGIGAERLLEDGRETRAATRIAAAVGALLLVAGVWAWAIPASSEPALSPIGLLGGLARGPDFTIDGELSDWRRMMLHGLIVSGALSLAVAALLWLAPGRRWVATLLIALAIAEVFVFARGNRGVSRSSVEFDHRPMALRAYGMAETGRVMETATPSNIAMARGKLGTWGYDPVILGRYIRFMVHTQGGNMHNIRKPTRFVPHHYHPLYAMLRTHYQVEWKIKELVEHADAMPRFVFVRDFVIAEGPDAVMGALESEGFDPRRKVILEEAPSPEPARPTAGAPPDRLWVLDQSTDHVDVEIDLSRAAILLMTDSYSRGWRAIPLGESAQDAYTLQPANQVLRALPLAAGHHRVRIEYAPLAYRAGLLTSLLSVAGYGLAVVFWCTRTFLRRRRAAAL